jgi:hypothetical protein
MLNKYIKTVFWSFGILISAYLVSMVAMPFYLGDWQYVQSVWDRWQGFNVGMIALTSSVIALYITRYRTEQEKKQNFIAARAFFPQALSDISAYCKAVFDTQYIAHRRIVDEHDECKTALEANLPVMQGEWMKVFKECILYADPEVGDCLAHILGCLQINNVRVNSLFESFSPSGTINTVGSMNNDIKRNIEVLALVSLLFPFARGEENFKSPSLNVGDYFTALNVAKTAWVNLAGLQDYIEETVP